VLGEVISTGLPVMISTIYDSNLDDERDREIHNFGLSVFNDTIIRVATIWNVPIMDLRGAL
jgi:hypothetical protein